MVAVVADGAGSAVHASTGSRLAVRAVLDVVRGWFEADVCSAVRFEDVFVAAADRLSLQAEIMGVDKRELASTLSVLLVHGGIVVVGQIGDGIICIETDSERALYAEPDRSEYANETVFLTSPDAVGSLKSESFSLDQVRAVALSSDGLKYKITDVATRTAFDPFFIQSFDSARAGSVSSDDLAAFLQSITDDQTGDDKTLVLAVPGADVAYECRVNESIISTCDAGESVQFDNSRREGVTGAEQPHGDAVEAPAERE